VNNGFKVQLENMAAAKAFASDVAGATKDFQDMGSAPLEKNEALEQKVLFTKTGSCYDGNLKLPQEWMGLACFRTRKYDEDRTKLLLSEYLDLLKELNTPTPLTVNSIKPVLETGSFRLLRGRDRCGRPILNSRLRFHDPKKFPAESVIRAIVMLICNSMTGVPFVNGRQEGSPDGQESQLKGITILHDFSDVKLSNFDKEIPKRFFKILTGKMPVRLGAIYIYNPPWFFSYIIWPIVRLVMNKKLSSRITIIYDLEEFFTNGYFSRDQLPPEYGGTGSQCSFKTDELTGLLRDMTMENKKTVQSADSKNLPKQSNSTQNATSTGMKVTNTANGNSNAADISDPNNGMWV